MRRRKNSDPVKMLDRFLLSNSSEEDRKKPTYNLPEGLILDSPYGKNIKIMVIRSGPAGQDAWLAESRNIYEDYRKAFEKKPRVRAGAIAIMCDADSTKSVAESYFDDISIAKE